MSTYYCTECETELTLTGITRRHGSESLHCENCHLDHKYVKDPNGSNFLDPRDQHDREDCSVCANGGPTPPAP